MADETTITVSLPDVWTLAHWTKYQSARTEFIERRDKAKLYTTDLEADYQGALALIRAGFVHIKNAPDELARILSSDNQDDTPLSVIGFVRSQIITPMLVALSSPLEFKAISPNGSSSTEPIPSAMHVP